MQSSNQPGKISLPFANSGAKQPIPVASQVGIEDGRASYTDGFPPLTRTQLSAGGKPPFGTDFNGIFNAITAIQQWQSAGGGFKYDSAFAASIGGYPAGAVLATSDNSGFWINSVDGNSSDPESLGSGWQPVGGSATTVAMTNANVTLGAIQSAKPIIIITGTITANLQLILPTYVKTWVIVNNASGAFTVTIKTASGSGVVTSPSSVQGVLGDGTSIIPIGPASATRVVKITSTSTYTRPAGLKAAFVQVQASGGGGGASQGGASGSAAGSGGHAGGYSEGYFLASDIGASQSVTIGAAGAGGTGPLGSGTAGGAASFGSLLTATGGSFGNAGANLTGIQRGTEPALAGAGSGSTQIGQNGSIGSVFGAVNQAIAGDGGSSRLGCGGRGRNEGSNGLQGTGYGSGGAGAASSTVNQNGGAGAIGIVIVTEYY